MGFSPQSNHWQCGPYALKHALLTLGIFANEEAIARYARSDRRSGTDEVQLARAARRYDCDLSLVRKFDAAEARRGLVGFLRRGIPSLVCIYEWSHWVTVVKEEKGSFILLDSKDEAVLTILTWQQFSHRWVFHMEDEDQAIQTVYDFHPVVPQYRTRTRARVSLARARFLRRAENREFAHEWDKYVEDLLAICRPRTPLSSNFISLREFLRRHGKMMVNQVAYWHGWIERRRAEKILENLHFVADTYGLVIPVENEKRAIAGITALLTLWAGGRYGVTPVYQEVPKRSRNHTR